MQVKKTKGKGWLEPSKTKMKELQKKGQGRNYLIGYRDSSGRTVRKSTGTDNWDLAEEMLNEFNSTIKRQADTGIVEKLFFVVSEEMIATNDDILPQSAGRYTNFAKSFVQFCADKYQRQLMIGEINDDVIDALKKWSAEIIEYPNARNGATTDRRYGYKSTSMLISHILAVLKFAKKKKYITEVPEITNYKKKTVKNNQKQVRGFTDEEITQIFTDTDLHENIHQCFTGLLYLGCRLSELCQLDWTDFQLNNGSGYKMQILHNPSIGRTTKTKKTRCVPIAKPLEKMLLEMKKECPKGQKHIFSGESGNRVDKHLYDCLMVLCKKYDITGDVTLHSFRHNFIQRHLAAGTNFRTIMLWSGHENLDTFMVYLNMFQPSPEDVNKVKYDF